MSIAGRAASRLWRTLAASLGALATALALADCGARAPRTPKPDYPPPAQRVDRTAVQALRTVCLEEFSVPEVIPEAKAREKAYVDLLRAELARGNLALVGKDETKGAFDRASRKVGGAFDRDTGATDEARFDKARAAGLGALRGELACDATMRAQFAIVRSLWESGHAVWDGVRQPVPGSGPKDYGWVAALSLWIEMDDMAGREIYFGAGGVQVLAGLRRHGRYVAPEETVVEKKSLLASEELNRKSIEVALAPFFSARWGEAGAPAGPAAGETAAAQPPVDSR
jgi:hypothetical protein